MQCGAGEQRRPECYICLVTREGSSGGNSLHSGLLILTSHLTDTKVCQPALENLLYAAHDLRNYSFFCNMFTFVDESKVFILAWFGFDQFWLLAN